MFLCYIDSHKGSGWIHTLSRNKKCHKFFIRNHGCTGPSSNPQVILLFITPVAALRKEKKNDRKAERKKERKRKKRERACIILIINAKEAFFKFCFRKGCSSIVEMLPDGPCCSEIMVSLCYIKWPELRLLQSDHSPDTMYEILKQCFSLRTEIKIF